jgi:DNA processing protein
LAEPPRRLHVLGTLPAGPAVAVVGARAADRQGLRVARELASDLARAGVAVVSGGANGIDKAAHLGALEGGGATVMVLGCGLEVEYPAGSLELRARVAASGAVVSELEPLEKPRPLHFPRRNRIVAALSDAVVVVQAGERSGALVTARMGRALGLEVLAVPGTPNAPLTRGTHGLLRSGALLAEGAADVLTAMGLGPMSVRSGEARPRGVRLSGVNAEIVDWLSGGPASTDDLARGLNRHVSEILAALVELEVDGIVACSGGNYERC